MEKARMKAMLDAVDPSTMPHIFCPSYNRPDFVSAQLFRTFQDDVKEKVHIVVRAEQYEAYKEANPDLDVIPIPEDYPINGLASTRQFIFEYAAANDYDMIIDMDDDIKYIAYMYNGVSGTGTPCSKHTVMKDREEDPLLEQKVLLMASKIAREVFEEHPTVYLGNIRRQRLSQGVDNAMLKYIINLGPTPRQVTLMNVKGLVEADINRDVERFDRHGDDIGFCAVILKAGGSLFNIPCLTYDYVSEKCDSVIRTPETEKELHAYEYNMLQQYPIKDYLRTTFRDEEGNYMWGDVDFKNYHKLMGTKGIKEFWDGAPEKPTKKTTKPKNEVVKEHKEKDASLDLATPTSVRRSLLRRKVQNAVKEEVVKPVKKTVEKPAAKSKEDKPILREQEAPFSIQVEFTEGCNRGCGFCGLQGMREHGKEPFYFMQPETAERIADEIVRIGWNSRIIFSMHGEPTLNKNYLKYIKLFRSKLPNAVMSIMTNAYELAKEEKHIGVKIKLFEKAGINDLIVDMYAPKDDGHKVLEYCEQNGIEHQILGAGVPLYGNSSKKFRILFNPPIQTDEGAAINRHLCNHCGAAAPLDFSYDGKRCARPFREMTFRYNGNVALCCNDFRGQYPIGNIMDRDIDDIWQDEKFYAARVMLYAGDRKFTPCLGCNALSHRVGLLPDLKGSYRMEDVTDEIRKLANSVAKENEPLCGDDWFQQKWDKR